MFRHSIEIDIGFLIQQKYKTKMTQVPFLEVYHSFFTFIISSKTLYFNLMEDTITLLAILKNPPNLYTFSYFLY